MLDVILMDDQLMKKLANLGVNVTQQDKRFVLTYQDH
jgi:hypothetical protein